MDGGKIPVKVDPPPLCVCVSGVCHVVTIGGETSNIFGIFTPQNLGKMNPIFDEFAYFFKGG